MARKIPLKTCPLTGVVDENGKALRWYGAVFDIDDQKNAEEALRVS